MVSYPSLVVCHAKWVNLSKWQGTCGLPEGFLSAVFDLNKIVWEIIAYNFQSLQAQNN